MSSGIVLLILTCIFALFVTLVVSLAHNVSLRTKLAFILFCVPLILWQVTISIADNVHTHLIFWNSLVFFWPTLAVLGCYAFVKSITRRKSAVSGRFKSIGLWSVFVLTLLQLGAIASNEIFVSITYDATTATYAFIRGDAYTIYILAFVSTLLVAVGRLIMNYAWSRGHQQERRALRIVLITIALTAAYGVTTNVLLPVITGSQSLISLGLFAVDIFALGLALSIIRYRFLDIRMYVFRAVGYISTFLLVATVYAIVVGIVAASILHIRLTMGAMIALSLITLAVAVSFNTLHVHFNRLTSRLFLRDYYEPQDVLDNLGDLLVGTVDVREIKDRSGQIIEAALRPTFLRFALIKDASGVDEKNLPLFLSSNINVINADTLEGVSTAALSKAMRAEDIGLAVRVRTAHEDLGFMLLGHRKAGTGYSMGDMRFLGVVADQIAIALQNALRFQEIEKFNETLQEKVEEATKKLRRTNERLRVLDQTKDDFISMASHQLRTPLTSVKGYVSMVLDGDAGRITAVQRKLLNQSFISSQRMVYLISDLLNVSRLRTGKFIIENAPINLAKVIEEEVGQLLETVKGRNLELNYHKPEHFPLLMLDETKIRQVLMNFIDNAVYYTPSGGHIDIYLEEKPQSIEFRVVDDGIGVPRHEQHHLFTKFYRAHNAKRARPDGTGLGIFMAKKVIIAQGGAVIFKSQEGKGSTFGFTFPKHSVLAPEKTSGKGQVKKEMQKIAVKKT